MRFWKYHALGNDYLVLDPRHWPTPPDGPKARRLCDRHRGIGADGILYGPIPDQPPFSLLIFNSDGSQAEKSGNGLRIFARFLRQMGYVNGRTTLTLRTPQAEAVIELLSPDGSTSRVAMGKASADSVALGLVGPPRTTWHEQIHVGGHVLRCSLVSVGNPHCVVWADASDLKANSLKALAMRYGPLIEGHEMFPNRTNVQFARVLDQGQIQIEIWERGSGYTLASGSSSCAVAAAAHHLGLVGPDVTVHMPGGALDVAIGADGTLWLTGPVTYVCQGTCSAELTRSSQT